MDSPEFAVLILGFNVLLLVLNWEKRRVLAAINAAAVSMSLVHILRELVG